MTKSGKIYKMTLIQLLLPLLAGIIWASKDIFHDCKEDVNDLETRLNLSTATSEDRLLNLNCADEIKSSEKTVKRKKKEKLPKKDSQKVKEKTAEQIEEERQIQEKSFEIEALNKLNQIPAYGLTAEYKEEKATFSFSFKHHVDTPKSCFSIFSKCKKSPLETFQEKIENVDFVTYRSNEDEVVIVVHSRSNEHRAKSQFDEFVVDFKAKTVERNIIRARYGENDFEIDDRFWIWSKERHVSDKNPYYKRSKNKEDMFRQTRETKEKFYESDNPQDMREKFEIGGSGYGGYGTFLQGKKYNLTH